LGRRALGRALLARQLLLRRAELTPAAALEHLVGLQAQAPNPPYYGLWSRLEGFDPNELGAMITSGDAVRLKLLRGTVHLVTAADALALRPLLQSVGERGHAAALRRRMEAADLDRLAAVVGELLAGEPMSAREIARHLAEREIGEDVEALTNAVTTYVPLVQLPPRGVWGAGGRARYATLEAWTGGELEREPSIDDLLLRYLGAFGPATVRDAQRWSGLTALGPAFERLRGRLLTFRGEDGAELFDLPDAPRPHPDVPAPPRFLGQFDNVLLGHADRSRVIPEGGRWDPSLAQGAAGGRHVNHLLVDGMARAIWWFERGRTGATTLAVRPLFELAPAERKAVAAEAERMADFGAADAEVREIRIESPG
jgi:hypothetical protein